MFLPNGFYLFKLFINQYSTDSTKTNIQKIKQKRNQILSFYKLLKFIESESKKISEEVLYTSKWRKIYNSNQNKYLTVIESIKKEFPELISLMQEFNEFIKKFNESNGLPEYCELDSLERVTDDSTNLARIRRRCQRCLSKYKGCLYEKSTSTYSIDEFIPFILQIVSKYF